MAEPIKIVLTNSGPFDGSSPINVTRADLEGSGPVYQVNVNGGGYIDSSIMGLVSPTTAKVVSIAIDSDDPGAIAKVTSANGLEPIRHVVLNSSYQSVLMAGNEVLRIVWPGDNSRSRKVNLLLQDLAEGECTRFMRVEHRELTLMSRFFIEVQGGGGFEWGPNPLSPIWTFNQALKIRQAAVPSGQGWLSVGDLAPFDKHYRRGIYVWARMSGEPSTSTLAVGLKAPFGADYGEAETAKNMRWTRPIWMSATDKMGFKVEDAAGAQFSIELDVSPVMSRRITNAVT